MSGGSVALAAIHRQLQLMRCAVYDIGVLDADRQMQQRIGRDVGSVIRLVSWLRLANARGAHIYVRPSTTMVEHDLVLVDDLDAETVEVMKGDGIDPALIVETSPGNYQCWVRLAEPQPIDRRKAVARVLARQYGGDIGSADGMHYGRLAGFTNRKPTHEYAPGRYPWVRCRGGFGQVAAAADELLDWAIEWMETETDRPHQPETIAASSQRLPQYGGDPVGMWQAGQALMRGLYGVDADQSRIDYAIARRLLHRGYSPATVEQVMLEASSHLAERKGRHTADYVRRTVQAAGGVS